MKPKATQMNLVVPQKLLLELHQVIGPNPLPQVLQLPSGRIAIELHEPPDTRPKLQRVLRGIGRGVLFIKDVFPPLASAIIAFFVLYYGKQFNDRAAKTQEDVASTQARQADTAKSELELKILSDFTGSLAQLTDESAEAEKKQTLAAIKFVQYGEEVLPVIKIALGVEESSVRRGATVVVAQMFQSGRIDRVKLLHELKDYFKNQNAYLRRGVLECFVKLGDHLSGEEASEVVNLLKDDVDPRADCSKPEEENVLLEAAKFLRGRPSLDSKELLLRIAENRSCTKPRIQAVDNLPSVAAGLPLEGRNEIVARLRVLESDASKSFLLKIQAAIENIEATKGR
jgi:hypothetical protein